MEKHNVGIRSLGSYVPEGIRDSFYISEASGIPEPVIREKFGIKLVHKAGPEESVSAMGVKAALRALDGMDPMAFEIHNLCSGGVYGLKVLKAMMLQDPSLRRVLMVSSSKEGDLINYKDTDSRFMFNFGDGAAAVVLERDLGRNVILESAMIADGQFSTDVYVPGIGCNNRDNFDNMTYEDRFLRVRDLKDMKSRLDPVTLKNFCGVMEQAVANSGYTNSDVGFIAPICMKKSMLVGLLDHFGLTEDKSFLLEDYGHCQSADCFISMEEGLRHGRLADGDLVVTISAGTGYTWASTVIRWGPCDG